MGLAMGLGALLVVALDVIRLALGSEVDPDVGLALLRCLPRWALALPLVCAAWGALGEASAARIERASSSRAARLALDAWLALPLWLCLPPLFAGAAIRHSAWRWPGLVAALLLTLLALSAARHALSALALSPLPRPLRGALPLVLLTPAWLATQANLSILRGLYPAFHLLLSLAALITTGLLVQFGLGKAALAQRGPSRAQLGVLAALSWVGSGWLGLPAGLGRLALIEGAPLLGALVVPAHGLDTALANLLAPAPARGATRPVRHEALVPAGSARRSVLLITVDALRADALDPHSAVGRCMPGLNALAGRAVRHERAYAPSNETVLSLVALLAGRSELPAGGDLARAELLPEAFARAGWASYAWFTGHDMPPVRSDLAAARQAGFGFQAYRKDYRGASEVLRWAEGQLRADPAFLWLHLSDVHLPFHLPLGATPQLPGCQEPYLLRHAALDATLAPALERLAARDPQLLWAVTADHGESRGERGAFGHGANLFDDQVRVPLVIGGAGLAAARVAETRSLYALGPTLLAAASRDAPTATLVWTSTAQPATALLVSRSQCGLVSRSHKLVVHPGAGTLALFDLARDPDERVNLAAAEAGRAQQLLQQLARGGCPMPGLDRLTTR
jgi:hypothetical protein